MKQSKLIFLSFLFACVGITVEIFFTAFYDVLKNLQSGSPVDWSLSGKSYVWMAFIYGLIPFILKWIHPLLGRVNLFIKAAIGVVFIFIIEFISGWLLELITGKCPWEYTEGWHIMGYIRLDYSFFWYFFALGVILLYQTLEKRL